MSSELPTTASELAQLLVAVQAVMVAVPAAAPVTSPLLTVATEALLVLQLTTPVTSLFGRPVRPVWTKRRCSCPVMPSRNGSAGIMA